MGRLESPVVTIRKGKDVEKIVLVSSTETGPAPVSVNAEGLKSGTVTFNFTEKIRYCIFCGWQLPRKNECYPNQNCQKPLLISGMETKTRVKCAAVIPLIAKSYSECGKPLRHDQ